jgi:phospholipid/cholesterol/gamma-HCH transport system permease protein
MADFMGMVGGAIYSIKVLNVDTFHYLYNARELVGLYDLLSGVFKSLFFGAAIALISCHRGFNCDAGAEGVGRAATASFVYSFVIILILNFLLGIALDGLYQVLWPDAAPLL